MFNLAKPIFAKGKSEELNVYAVFKTTVDSLKGVELKLTAASFYQVYVNGKFVGFGPARTAKGYARMDVLPLEKYAVEGKNEIVIGVAGYYCRSFNGIFQPSFLRAEVVRGDEVVACTGRDFDCYLPASHIQKTERYSAQRHFSEVWDFTNGKSLTDESYRTEIENLPETLTVLNRTAPYPYYEDVVCDKALVAGHITTDETVIPKKENYSFALDDFWQGFDYDEIEYHPYAWVQTQVQHAEKFDVEIPLALGDGEYAIFDLERVETGFLKLSAKATATADVVIAFSEYIPDKTFQFANMQAHNVCEVKLGAGDTLDWMSREPYVLRYAIVALKSGAITLDGFGVKKFEGDVSGVVIPELENPVLRDIYRAAVRTYAHNVVDVYMDCPSRERAGWLCDSYFTGKTEHFLFGKTDVEDAYLENYRLYKNDGELPEGAIPMCFPADVKDTGEFIPQWTMWYILEVEEYLLYRNKSVDREAFRDSIYGLLGFYARHENEDGLLENLPSWNFVEWSRANHWVFNVNYPTNFLYARVLEAVYNIFGDEDCLKKCAHVRGKAVEQSFDGKLFCDHAVRGEDGKLVRCADISEICQYYAILFAGIDTAKPEYAYMMNLIENVFGAVRKEPMPEIEEINAFIGVYLRLEAMLKLKKYDLVLNDIETFFGDMERLTGTLWENRSVDGSLDHGFACYALVAMTKALEAKK